MESTKTPKPLDPYTKLPFAKLNHLQFSSSTPFTPTYVISNLTSSSDPAAVYASRVKGRQVMLENPARDSKARQELILKRTRLKEEKQRKKLRSVGKRGTKVIRERGIWKLDPSQAKFKHFLPLHHLWMGYMSELLGLAQPPASGPSKPLARHLPNSSAMHPKLVKADFHGSILSVRKSKNPCLIGLSGIVIHETENAFKVVTREDKMKVIPKQNSIFALDVPLYSTLPTNSDLHPAQLFAHPHDASHVVGAAENPLFAKHPTVLDVPHMEFELYGNQFRFRAAERAGRKFKHKETIEL